VGFWNRCQATSDSSTGDAAAAIAGTDAARRSFAVYWRIIHPGSDIIRRMWLRAVKLRAEGKSSLS